MSTTQPEANMLPNDIESGYSAIEQEDWIKDLLEKLSPDEQDTVLDAFRDLKRFSCKKSS